jgi:hypothetical protein
MELIIKTKVKQCRYCPHMTNSSKEHDCAFTDAPLHVTWWCIHPERKGTSIIQDENKIDKLCPEKENK